ncbi:MAG TPA: alpha/beta fold hydrolase [Solirubrobacteraceae bacterium]|jgi:pimeloyl-ACP methyl ester carboxylesterase|nr:alpha/beta fold hydrolase [Solirubrobacteraceae bacterium]
MPARPRILPSTARPASLRAAAHAEADYGRSDQPDWRSVNWRAHLRAVTVDGRRVHLVDIGSGPAAPVLFVHGLGGRWQNWLENIPRLARSRRVVAIDLPGFGRSQLPRREISLAGYAEAIERVCDLLEIESAVLVGNSMGGAVAAQTALASPRLVERLVLVSAAAISIRDFNPAPAAALMAVISHTPLGRPAGVRSAIRRRRARHLALATLVRHPTLIATDMLSELVGGRGAPGLAAAMTAMIAGETGGELASIKAPTLIVQGREDMLVPLADSVWLSSQISGARLETIDDTGHLPMVERPVRFNDALLEFAAEA